MRYDPDKGRYVGEDGSEFKVTPYGDGSGYKYDYYDRSTYGNNPHNSTHVNSDLNENWSRTDNDRTNGSQSHSSGSGCYLTTACMQHMKDSFDDNCTKLMILRWFRDSFVSKEDIKHYYEVAPIIVDEINNSEECNNVYEYIYNEVILKCIESINNKNYAFAYNRYKSSVIDLEEKFLPSLINHNEKHLTLKNS